MSERTTSEVAVRNKMNIPEFRAGKDGPSIFSAGTMNILCRALRALTNPHITRGESDKVELTDGNFLIQLSRTSENEEGNSKVQQYVLTDASNGDYFVCRTWDDSGESPLIGETDIFIAKPFHLRQSPFDRDVLNEDDLGNIGTMDEITYQIQVERWDGFTLSSDPQKFSYDYKSSTYRIATDATNADPDNWTEENQTIIPRFVPAMLDEPEDGDITTDTIAPTIIYAVKCSDLGITALDDSAVTLLAINEWSWFRSPV